MSKPTCDICNRVAVWQQPGFGKYCKLHKPIPPEPTPTETGGVYLAVSAELGRKQCVYCGKGFSIYSTQHAKKYCSDRCKHRQYVKNAAQRALKRKRQQLRPSTPNGAPTANLPGHGRQ